MPDVADDRDGQTREAPLVLAHRQSVEQPLSRVRHMRFSRGQHTHVRSDIRRDQLGHALLCVTDDHHVHMQRLQRVHRVQHAFALGAG